MIKLWDETSNDWKTIKKARKLTQKQIWTTWLLELAGCVAIGLVLGWIFGRAW